MNKDKAYKGYFFKIEPPGPWPEPPKRDGCFCDEAGVKITKSEAQKSGQWIQNNNKKRMNGQSRD